MSGTHAQTAEAQADLQRADAVGGKPHFPPGHVEAERPIRRVGNRVVGTMLGGALALVAIAVVAAFIIA